MTTGELSREFDILYDSIASNSAPGLDEYEKSVFLTKAQLEIIKEYNGPANKYKQSFEGSEKRRVDLKETVLNYSVIPTIMVGGLEQYSQQAVLPNDCFLIRYESGISSEEGCQDIKLNIIPIKYDEYKENKRNPFRRLKRNNGYRLDLQSRDGKKIVELVAEKPINSYQIRYVQYPLPIVLQDLDGISPLEALTIDGVSTRTECKLDNEIHREILDRAVELAMLAYKQEALSAQIQVDQRNN